MSNGKPGAVPESRRGVASAAVTRHTLRREAVFHRRGNLLWR